MILTKEEQKWINDFKKLAKKCPKSLWLFAGTGMNVLKTDADGNRKYNDIGSVDHRYLIDTIDIPCDGGDF